MEEVLHCVLCMSQATAGPIPYPNEAAEKRNVEKNIRIIKLSQPANDPSRALIVDKTLRRRKDDTKMVSCKVTDRNFFLGGKWNLS